MKATYRIKLDLIRQNIALPTLPVSKFRIILYGLLLHTVYAQSL